MEVTKIPCKMMLLLSFSVMAPSQSPIISAQYNHLRRFGGGQNGGQNGSSNNSSPRYHNPHHAQNGHSPSLGKCFLTAIRTTVHEGAFY